MQGHGENLANAYSSATPATQGPVNYKGGRGCLVITAATYPTSTILQYIARNGVAIDLVTVTTNGVYALDLPAGQYQLAMAAGVASAVTADLVAVRYG